MLRAVLGALHKGIDARHPGRLAVSINLATTLARSGKHKEAVALFDEIRPHLVFVYAPNPHTHT
jgi:hypothetical protein